MSASARFLVIDGYHKAARAELAAGGASEAGALYDRMLKKCLPGAVCDILDAMVPAKTPRRNLIRFVADRPGHDRRYAMDPAKIEAELGWQAQESFATGLQKTVRWYVDNQAWWRPLRNEVYGGERLGLTND